MENNTSFRVNLKSLSYDELEAFIVGLAVEKYRAQQIATWIFKHGVTSFQEMTNLSKDLRRRLETKSWISKPDIKTRLQSKRGDTVKYLFALSDGQLVESVLMRHDYGRSVCVSTQVGCRYGCRLCASGLEGLVRSLDAGEIYDQVLGIENDIGERISSLVIMGSGEPLDNYRATLVFIKNIAAPYGLNIGYRHITISTCGLVPGIRRLAAEGLPLTLAVSLHAPNDSLRDQLVPINKKYPLSELITASRDYVRETGRRITFEYALVAGVNDSAGHARELCGLLQDILCHVNLIPANQVIERGVKPPTKRQIELFRSILESNMLTTTVRREFGSDINAACGQLRRRILPGTSKK
ncbi:MAG: 23S rRNA (adenine(2503)-C(2))-methyltransferase RlmN [Peptococcaceae bacterium]|nr:23S rRNA (adenine(2503)-C(2))-methyltransferase RlmN [Peptococcaceae bacterium]